MSKAVIVVAVVVLFATAAYTFAPRRYLSSKHPMLDEVRSNFAKIDSKYANIPLREGNDGAYTENKSLITLCLKDPKTGEHYDMNTIMYVALHELAHMVSKSYGHNDEFKKNFTELLKRGAKIGVYDPRRPIPSSYCGVNH